MAYFEFAWTPEIEDHLAEHGVTWEDFERAVENAYSMTRSRTSNRPACYGPALDGRTLFCVFHRLDEFSIEPVTAFFLE